MKIVFLLEFGIPIYRDFLFERIQNDPRITEIIVLHNGKLFDGKKGTYIDKKLEFIGTLNLGWHKNILKYIKSADLVISSYNLRILSCWIPSFIFSKKWIFWGKGLGSSESSITLFLRKLTTYYCKKIILYNNYKRLEFIHKTKVNPDKVISYQNTVFIEKPENTSQLPKHYFLYFGRIQQRKGLKELIIQYNQYVEKVIKPRYKLRLVGNGDFKSHLVELVKQYNIEQYVEFYPGTDVEAQIRNHFSSAIAYVSPFNVGLAIVHSFSYGVPVITCKTPQIAPEFFYLNSENSIIIENLEKFQEVFVNIDTLTKNHFHNIYEYYMDHLHHDIMYKNFVKAILE